MAPSVTPQKRKAMAMDSDGDGSFDGLTDDDGSQESIQGSSRTRSMGGQQSSPSSSKKGKGKGNSRGGNQSKKERESMPKWCRGCLKHHPAEQFAANQNMCHPLKKAKDNLKREAKKQGSLEWFEETEKDEKMFSHLLLTYMARKQTQNALGGKAASFPFAQYREKFETATEVLLDDKGAMYNEEGYLNWATTLAAVKITRSQALRNWDGWRSAIAKNPKAILNDKKGPEESPLRIRVAERDEVTYRNRYTKAKEYSAYRAPDKKPTEELIAQRHSDLLKGHDEMVVDADWGDIAQNMLDSGAAGSSAVDEGYGAGAGGFDGAGVNVKSLLEESSEEEEGESAEGDPWN